MATVSPKPTPPARRPPSASPTPTTPIARGATARSALSPRVSSSLNSPASRRQAPKAAQPGGDAHETLTTSLKQETEKNEQLLVQLQNKDQTITSLTAEVETLTAALSTAETRLNELYTEQARSELELAQRIEVAEKLRTQVRELEKEKRDLQRRYNEQTATFDAERQVFYDNEQLLKSRIQSLNEALKRAQEAARQEPELSASVEEDRETESKNDADSLAPKTPVAKSDFNDPESEPAEMTALKLELSTLSTSYSSLQSTLVLLQTQLMDLKRVNQQLQEDNESYMILLREKTLTGQFDVMKQVGASDTTSDDGYESDDNPEQTDVGSLRSIGRSTLDRVDEEIEGSELEASMATSLEDDLDKPRFSRHSSRQGRKRTNSTHETRGESLAGLPITGPGLDLAAELGRAENKDIFVGNSNAEETGTYSSRGKRTKKSSDPDSHLNSNVSTEMETMRAEIKSLKDANKALSLYASKIIDRIISEEGFEHVLAADYDKPDKPSRTTTTTSVAAAAQSPLPAPKSRPQSLFVGRSLTSAPGSESQSASTNLVASPKPSQPSSKANRRSLSFDWKGFSIFSSSTEKKPDSNLRPLTLKPGATALTSARKLETYEDEEDRKERERLNATMKLMGIQPPPSQSPVLPSAPTPGSLEGTQSPTEGPSTAKANRRFSFFGLGGNSERSENDSSATPDLMRQNNGSSDVDLTTGLGTAASANLTHEALEQAEAVNSLAALDAHERNLSVELAKGGNGGFTEIAPRQGRRSRSRKSGAGSGSTVWSAGLSAGEE